MFENPSRSERNMRAPWGPIMESIYTIVHTGRVGLPNLLSHARILSMHAWEERTQKKKNAVLDMQVQLVGKYFIIFYPATRTQRRKKICVF